MQGKNQFQFCQVIFYKENTIPYTTACKFGLIILSSFLRKDQKKEVLLLREVLHKRSCSIETFVEEF